MGTSVMVAASLARARRKIINPMGERLKEQTRAEKRYIFNITEVDFPPIYRTWGVVKIGPKEPGTAYSVTEVIGRVENMDSGIEDSYMEVITTAEQVAEDIEQNCNGNLPQYGVTPFAGIFWGEKPEPEAGKLKEAVEKLTKYYKSLVNQADTFWQTERFRVNIDDSMRRAARALNIDRSSTWLSVAEEHDLCPACGAVILPGVAVCRTCNAVLDEEKARKFFPDRFLGQQKNGTFSSGPLDE
jgi:hypothetical protein